ncbi:hypothetical protein TKK_0004320 [Trichogramma kaykai]|uniref:Fibronectin type-III domain-containing protein n=1 Tax=Trichogramma kaykai TaxID=54128 RepID=A0ABD2XLL8_9HYME
MSRSALFFSLFVILACVSIVLGVKNPNLRSSKASRNVIRNLQVSDIDSTSAKISWNASEDKILDDFTIEVSRNGESVLRQTISDATSWLARDLEPCTKYNVTVTSTGSTIDTVHTEFATSYVTPVWSTRHGAITQRPSGLKLVWTPAQPESCVKTYRLEIDTRDPDLEHAMIAETTATQYAFENLYACARYWYTVSLVDLQGNVFQFVEGRSVAQFAAAPEAPTTSRDSEPLLTRYTATVYLNASSTRGSGNCSLELVRAYCEVTSSPVPAEQGRRYELQTRVRPGQARDRIPIELERLAPYTYFSCRAAGVNGAGPGPLSRPITFRTSEDYPFPPWRLRVEGDGAAAGGTPRELVWEPPRWLAGALLGYRLRLTWRPNYPLPGACPSRSVWGTKTMEVGSGLTRLSLLDEATSSRYVVKMASRTGLGYSHETVIDYTSPVRGVPDKITNLSYNIVPVSAAGKIYDVTLSWQLPCSPKGNLREFEVEARDGRGQLIADLIVPVPEERVQPDQRFRAVLSQLAAVDDGSYDIAITPVVRDGQENDGRGEVERIAIQIPAWRQQVESS